MGALKTYYTTAKSFLHVVLTRRDTSGMTFSDGGGRFRLYYSNTISGITGSITAKQSIYKTPVPLPSTPKELPCSIAHSTSTGANFYDTLTRT